MLTKTEKDYCLDLFFEKSEHRTPRRHVKHVHDEKCYGRGCTFCSWALVSVVAQIYEVYCATRISGKRATKDMVLACRGLSVNRNHLESFSGKNDADSRNDPFNIPSSPGENSRQNSGTPLVASLR